MYVRYINNTPILTIPKTILFKNVGYKPKNLTHLQAIETDTYLEEAMTNDAYYHIRFDVDLDTRMVPINPVKYTPLPVDDDLPDLGEDEFEDCQPCLNERCEKLRQEKAQLASFLNKLKNMCQSFEDSVPTWGFPPTQEAEDFGKAATEAPGAYADIMTNYYAVWVHPKSGEIRTSNDNSFIPIETLRQLPKPIKDLMPLIFDSIMQCLNIKSRLLTDPEDPFKEFIVMSLLNRIEREHLLGVINYLLQKEPPLEALIDPRKLKPGEVLLAPNVCNLLEGTRIWIVFSIPRTLGNIEMMSEICNIKYVRQNTKTGSYEAHALPSKHNVIHSNQIGAGRVNSLKIYKKDYFHRLRTLAGLLCYDRTATSENIQKMKRAGVKPTTLEKMSKYARFIAST